MSLTVVGGRAGVLVSGGTLFLALDDLYPECRAFTRPHPRMRPFACIQDGGCHLGLNGLCMETLARRLSRLFTGHADVVAIVVHWALADASQWGVAFDRALSAPRVRPLRPAYLRHYLANGAPFPVSPDLFA